MKHRSLSALLVAALILIDVSFTMAIADSRVTIFKVTKVATNDTLNMRAWPSAKSRIKIRLPYNAKDLTETGKQRIVGGAKWIEVNWQKSQGWVRKYYLAKTGVLLHANKVASRNTKASINASSKIKNTTSIPVDSLVDQPEEFAGDRYDQSLSDVQASKVTYTESQRQQSGNNILSCNGKNPRYWNIKLDMSNRNIQVKFPQKSAYNVPIKYHAWEGDNKVAVNIGGSKGRNIIDVNLKKTNACYNDMTQSALAYEVNAAINNQYFSGCCQTVN